MVSAIIHIREGKITNRAAVVDLFKELTNGRYEVKVNEANKRSLNQNAYYHGVVIPLIKEGLRGAGYNEVKTNEDAHEVLKYLFLKKKVVNENTGEFIECLGSTAKLSTVDFMAYIADIQQYAIEYLGIDIPSPNEQALINFE